MKRITIFLMTCLLLLSITACGGNETGNVTSSQGSNITVETPASIDQAETSSSDIQSEDENEPENEPEPVITTTAITVNEQILFDQDDIKMTLIEITDGWLGPGFKVLIENDSDTGITIQTRDSSVNGIMISTMLSASVMPGMKSNEEITIMSSQLERIGVDKIGELELRFLVFDSDTWDDLFLTDFISIRTSIYDNFVQEYNDSGVLLFNDNGIRVIIQSIDDEDSFWGTDIYVFVENFSDSDITIQLRNTSINGFMIDPIFSCSVLMGKRAFDSITFLQSHLEDNNITSIDEIQFALNIFDADSWKDIVKTDQLIVRFD